MNKLERMGRSGLAMLVVLCLLPSCISNKKYAELEGQRNRLNVEIADYNHQVSELQKTITEKENQLALKAVELQNANLRTASAEEELDYLKNSNTLLLDRLADLSVVSKTGVESIKQSLETLQERNEYIRQLTSKIQRKDSVNLMLVMNLKRSLDSIDDEDVTVEVKKGVVYVSLSDKMLFKSGSSDITEKAGEVLGKIASVLNDHSHLDILVEGHTDNVPIGENLTCVKDNWDLSTQRAAAVVRMLQVSHGVDPARMTAGGRSKFLPVASNEEAAGRSQNRRTEIIILPKLDEFFKLLEPQMYGKIENH